VSVRLKTRIVNGMGSDTDIVVISEGLYQRSTRWLPNRSA
jgi:hypothetical protein